MKEGNDIQSYLPKEIHQYIIEKNFTNNTILPLEYLPNAL